MKPRKRPKTVKAETGSLGRKLELVGLVLHSARIRDRSFFEPEELAMARSGEKKLEAFLQAKGVLGKEGLSGLRKELSALQLKYVREKQGASPEFAVKAAEEAACLKKARAVKGLMKEFEIRQVMESDKPQRVKVEGSLELRQSSKRVVPDDPVLWLRFFLSDLKTGRPLIQLTCSKPKPGSSNFKVFSIKHVRPADSAFDARAKRMVLEQLQKLDSKAVLNKQGKPLP